jgi:hypothetical protein
MRIGYCPLRNRVARGIDGRATDDYNYFIFMLLDVLMKL